MSRHVGRLLTRAEYDHEIDLGLIEEGEPVELLAGKVVEVSPEGPSHASVQTRALADLLRALDGASWVVRAGNPIALSDVDEPEPDLAVARARPDEYRHSHPGPDEVHLVIEIANSSHHRDLVLKAERYARAGIRDYWVVDLIEGRTVVHREPIDGRYAAVTMHPAGASIATLDLDDVALTPLRTTDGAGTH